MCTVGDYVLLESSKICSVYDRKSVSMKAETTKTPVVTIISGIL